MKRRTFVLWAALGFALGMSSCRSDALRGLGETCTAATECAQGLLCDFQMNPPTCQGQGTPVPDAPIMIDAPPGTPDAPPTPDAPTPQPDAPLPPPDAAPVPDA